jgi:hypothetical protein
MSRHKVKGHYFDEASGKMRVHERFFPTFEAAKEFLNNSSFHMFKVYDDNEQLVHSGSSTDEGSSYA